MIKNEDLFSQQADLYQRYRPTYPKSLFDAIADKATTHELVWDCATGNGQAAIVLADYFDRVIATDVSENQLLHAQQKSNIEYKQARADDSGIDDHSVDCITIAQALHWFCHDDFYAEVKRTLKPGGLFATWFYSLPQCEDEAIMAQFWHFYREVLGEYWDKARHHIDNKYQDIYLPLPNQQRETFSTYLEWDFDHFIGYLNTWSAVQTYREQTGTDPVSQIAKPTIAKLWNDPLEKKRFQVELTLITAKMK